MTHIQILANSLGYIGMILIWLQIVLGSRHVFKYFTTDNVKMNKIHKWLGIYGGLLVFLHPIEEMMAYMSSWSWIFILNFNFVNETAISLGRIGLYLMLSIWVTSAIVREQIKWKPWKYIHLLAYPLFIFVWMHAMGAGRWAQNVYVLFFLKALMFVFLLILVRRLMSWSGFFKYKYKVKSIMIGDIITLTLAPIDSVSIAMETWVEQLFTDIYMPTPRIGQHIYMQTKRFRSEHPFTVMQSGPIDNEGLATGDIQLGIRNSGNFAVSISNMKIADIVYIDGPYGVFTKQAQSTEPKVIISAGVGVTPFVDLVRHFGGAETMYINCNKDKESVYKRDFLLTRVGGYIDVYEILNGNIVNNFLSIKGKALNDYKYFVCGSPTFVMYVKGLLKDLKVKKKLVFTEDLGY